LTGSGISKEALVIFPFILFCHNILNFPYPICGLPLFHFPTYPSIVLSPRDPPPSQESAFLEEKSSTTFTRTNVPSPLFFSSLLPGRGRFFFTLPFHSPSAFQPRFGSGSCFLVPLRKSTVHPPLCLSLSPSKTGGLRRFFFGSMRSF